VTNAEETYKSRLTTAEEAVKAVRSGDTVYFSLLPPRQVQQALWDRRADLKDVTIRSLAPAWDPGWFRPGAEEHFIPEFELFIGDYARFATDERRGIYLPNLFSLSAKGFDSGRAPPPDVVVVSVSPPNKQGYCHFGPNHWFQRLYARRARVVIAEVAQEMVHCHGDNTIHVSEISYFIPGPPPATITREEFETIIAPLPEERVAAWRQVWDAMPDPNVLAPFKGFLQAVPPQDAIRLLGLSPPEEDIKAIAGYLSELIEDGETIQIGTGSPSSLMPNLGVFDNRRDLGLHTELGSPGLGRLVQAGVITGKHKEVNPGKAVATAWTGCDGDDLKIIDGNPTFELYDPDYVLGVRTLSRFDRFVSINNGISVDLVGQIASESVFGGRMVNGSGGQPEMHLAAAMSPKGRAITLLPSTAMGGAISKIVPKLDAGELVTIPRFYADIVITEFGVARLFGKNHRQRAEELIAVAHPDFRAELRREARALFWP
jgi:4-hydroxybutyrate CoA-transferase